MMDITLDWDGMLEAEAARPFNSMAAQQPKEQPTRELHTDPELLEAQRRLQEQQLAIQRMNRQLDNIKREMQSAKRK